MGMSIDLRDKFKEMKSGLKRLGRYSFIVEQLEAEPHKVPASFIFEALFAHLLESNGTELRYEANINPDNDSTVDFIHEPENEVLAFELLSPDISSELKKETIPHEVIEGVELWEADLTSRHENPFLKPEAQTLRMQEISTSVDSIKVRLLLGVNLLILSFSFLVLRSNSTTGSSLGSCSTNFPRTARSRIKRLRRGMASGASLMRSKWVRRDKGARPYIYTLAVKCRNVGPWPL